MYTIYNYEWGYIMKEFNTLKEAKGWINNKGLRYEHKKGSKDLYAES